MNDTSAAIAVRSWLSTIRIACGKNSPLMCVMVQKSTLSDASLAHPNRPYLLCQRTLSIEVHRYHAPIAAVVSRSISRHNKSLAVAQNLPSFYINRNHQWEIFSVAFHAIAHRADRFIFRTNKHLLHLCPEWYHLRPKLRHVGQKFVAVQQAHWCNKPRHHVIW